MVHALVVDDDEETREVLRTLLEDEGYAVAEAADGLQTLDALRASVQPMVVVLDLDLPQLDGMGVLDAVAHDAPLAARHAFVLITAVPRSRYEPAAAAGAKLGVALVLKPFDLDALLSEVAAAAHRLPAAP